MLQGKAKEEFEKWLKKQPFVYFNKYTKSIIIHNRDWSELNQCFINSLIIDWFDSVGIYVNALRYGLKWKPLCENVIELTFSTRKSALNFAITKAVEIFNKLNE